MTDLFDPCEFNGLRLQNRIALSPLTRTRSNEAGEAGALQALYYAQRASAGLLITEATPVAAGGRGGPNIPGLWSDDQVAGWRQVTDAVHERGGTIFCQLWHAGRLSHSSLGGGAAPIAPSAMTQPGQFFTLAGPVPYEEARALRTDEMPDIVAMFASGARRAKAAGFDGVELHAAHSYLIDAFLRDMTNRRTDAYGGSVENRARLLVEVLEALVAVWGGARTAVRLAPIGHAYGAWDSDPEPLFTHVVERLNDLGVGWLDLVEGDTGISRTAEPGFDLRKLRRLFKGVTIANNLYDRELAIAARAADSADLIAFGRPFIGNPDLVERLRRGAPLTVADPRGYYGGGARGYTDFPTLEEEAAAAAG
ncbi:N-ethylmaleimide reductase [Caulobacter ginsengisoli]|uniref:N-ethylmaleimide reductase n=1 Tax=Caulobacter ginsengisoli TaxID=400775 RepID=A0ABU0IWD5_9CAUL|nr:alkene reductase [Caulobacter ginsengisoli]MDQ0466332.1 N-ethylmaleimide reductase [Caulobacter ginsengisoli]